MEVHRYLGGRLPVLVAGVLGIALAMSSVPATAADRGGSGGDYTLLSPTLTIDDVILNEGNAGTTKFTFTIALSKPADAPVCVDVYTQDGTATLADNDYQAVSMKICIPANTTTYTVDVLVNGDTTDEPGEVFFLKLANVRGVPGASIGDPSGSGLILNDDGGTPTLLQTFDASSAEEGITLRWQFANAADVASSFLERSAAQSDNWARVDADVRNEDGLLVLTDSNIESEATYQYRLTAQMKNGQTMRFGPITATAGVITKEFALSRVSPTPTRGPAVIDFAVPRAAHVKLSVLDIQGRLVETLVDGVVSSGRHSVTWNAGNSRNGSGAGIYFVRMESPGQKSFVKRVVVNE